MKFATIGHLIDEKDVEDCPKSWIHNQLVVFPELNINGTKGYLTALLFTARQVMEQPRERIRKSILDAAVYVQNELGVNLIQLGALTTSVTEGGVWMTKQREYTGYVNHGDSYTAAVTCESVGKSLQCFNKDPSDQTLAIVGAYGIIGEAVSKLLVPKFHHSILIGRRMKKLKELSQTFKGSFETTVDLKTKDADVIVTATSHPTSLLIPHHLKKNAIVVDVSQPPNLSLNVCHQRPDIHRVDGGFVDFPVRLPTMRIPSGKNFACIVEVIMQALEDDREHHVGSIDLPYLRKTEEWAKKYGFLLNELTNFGQAITCK
ncbi:MAG: hypothetical protein JW840_05920 [Candidatus Thermoplasmatota archaeon]|nr:hypothetical protein [Candidatus Thermoplasmatota archaeon]